MNTKSILIIILFISSSASIKAQSFGFTGLGRVLVTNNVERDNTNTNGKQKATDGYTLFDLGVNAESDIVRVGAIMRIKNQFGGLYSDGSSMGIRQIQMEGIIGKKIKYELGDIYMEQTPYTIYNFEEIYNTYEGEIFKARRRVVNYENFFIDSKWRLQGANASTRINFKKTISSIGMRAYAGRLGVTDFTSRPDQVFYGGKLDVIQSDNFTIGGNLVSITDLTRTTESINNKYDNTVATTDFKLALNKKKKIEFGLKGELGLSSFSLVKYNADTTTISGLRSDYFYDAGLYTELKQLNLKLEASYRNVGPGFISPMAQTRRIMDIGSTAELFPLLNDAKTIRATTLMDRYSQETGLYNRSVSMKLLEFNPVLNNITPYGKATPNREGITASIAYNKTESFLNFKLDIDKLKEVYTEDSATRKLRNFLGVKGGLVFNINKLLKYEKEIIFQTGGRIENTTRGGAYKVDLKSSLIDIGLQVEVLKGLSLLSGLKYLRGSGTEYLSLRDDFIRIATIYERRFDIVQDVWAFGGMYKFGKAGTITAQYHIANYNDKIVNSPDMEMKYLFMMYTLQF